MGHDALLLHQIARDLLHALSHRHDNTWTAFGEPVLGTSWGQVDNILIEFHLSETSRLCRARTWMACLSDGDANHYAKPPN